MMHSANKSPNKGREIQPPAQPTTRRSVDRFFNDETMASLRELGAVLEPIYRRLLAQGYVIEDGVLCKRGENAKGP
jgi:hypothetical protein